MAASSLRHLCQFPGHCKLQVFFSVWLVLLNAKALLDSVLSSLHFHFVLSLSSLTDAHTTDLYLLMNNLPCPVSARSPPQSSFGELGISLGMSHSLLPSVSVSFLLLQ